MSSISAGTTSITGLVATSDTTGTLVLQTGATPTTALTLGSDQSATFAGAVSTTGYVNAPNTFGFKNRIINGAMMIDQRNAGASVTAGSAYTLDRWNVDRVWAGSTIAIQQTPSTTETGYATRVAAGFTNYLAATVSTGAAVAAGSYFSIQQFLEGYNIADMAFGTANAQNFTVSFWVRSSVTGTFGVGFRNSAFDLSYWTTYTINAANTWEQKFVTITAPTSGTWYTNNSYGLNVIFSLGCGSTNKATSNNAWNAGSKLGAVGETDLIATTGATFYITGVQLEKGTVATSFDYRPYGTELALCQRYLPAFTASIINTPLCSAYTTSTTNARGTFVFIVTPRTAPTGVSISSSGHFGFSSSSGYTASNAAFSAANTNSGWIDFTISGGTAAQGGAIYAVNASAQALFTGCEL
jgi:hypothetical protein